MNAGKNHTKAKAQAQANANRSQSPRWLHQYAGAWWISTTPTADAERIDPTGAKGRHHSTKAAPTSQREMYYDAERRSAEINKTFLEMLPTMRRRDLEKLIEKRPSLWGRFAGYLTSGHVFADGPPSKTGHHATKKKSSPKKKSQSRAKSRKEIRRASITTDYFRGHTYGDVEWEDGSVTSGPLNTHMRALLDRARREGKSVRHKTIGA